MNFVECVYGIWIELDRHISDISDHMCIYMRMHVYIHGLNAWSLPPSLNNYAIVIPSHCLHSCVQAHCFEIPIVNQHNTYGSNMIQQLL